MNRRQFLGFGVGSVFGAGLALADVKVKHLPIKPIPAAGIWQTWDFHGWEAGIGPNGAGSIFILWRPGAGLAWGNELDGQQWVSNHKEEYAAALDMLTAVPAEHWNPLEVDRLWNWSGVVGNLTTWLGWTLTRAPARKVAGIRQAWKKDAWGKVLVAMAQGFEQTTETSA